MSPENARLKDRTRRVIDRSSVGLKSRPSAPLSRSNEPLPSAGNRNATTATTGFIPLYIAADPPTGIEQP